MGIFEFHGKKDYTQAVEHTADDDIVKQFDMILTVVKINPLIPKANR